MTDVGHNLTQLKIDCKQGVDQVRGLKTERTAINEAIAEVRARMEARGIKKAAFDMALRYLEWDEEKREGFDTAYAIVREAVSLPMDAQTDMFDEQQTEPDQAAAE